MTELTDAGSQLYAELMEGREADPMWARLALEAVRITERLDTLDNIIRNKGAIDLLHARRMDRGNTDTVKIVVTVDNVLAESREQAGQLRQIIAQLKLGVSSAQPKGVDKLDELARRRHARKGNAAAAI